MDDEITTAVAADDVPRGRVLQTFLVRVTLRANSDGSEGGVPTNDSLASAVHEGIYGSNALVDFFHEAISVTVEKV